ncbi:MAG: hypothetical protein JWM98_3293 [Thermoleophilia bacterium]|nr:hypothetical protein [Thermoleophilia bacterium]
MGITPLQLRMGAVAVGSTALAAGGTAAWLGADREHPGRERIAAAGYAPGVIGAAAAVTAGPVAVAMGLARLGNTAAEGSLLSKVGRIAKGTTGLGLAAVAGLVAGTAAVRILGPAAHHAEVRDDQLPEPDMARAKLEADRTYDALDRSKPNLVVWVPGTMRPNTPGEFRDGVQAAMGDAASLVNMPNRPDYQVQQGVADTSNALRLLLTRLEAERRPGQRILLAGESQGAWAMEVALQDPALAKVVDRAVVWGNPGVSPHQHDGAGDGKWLEMSEELDVVGRSLEGSGPMMLDGLTKVFDGDVSQVWRVPATMINNPHETELIAVTGLRLLTPGGYERDPHNYREFEGVAARFLADAPPHQAGATAAAGG